MKIIRPRHFFAAIVFLAAGFQSPAQTNSPDFSPAAILGEMQRVADWQLAHPDTNPPVTWPRGAGNAGMMALAGISGDAKYRDAMLAAAETNHWRLGTRFYDADDYCVGQAYAELFLLYRENKMIAPLRERLDAILAKPSDVQSLEFTKAESVDRKNWSWCDSLFMGPPTWLRLYAATGDERYLNFAVTNFWRATDYLYDKDEHLFFRDSTYFDQREANGKKVFWSRGNGWVVAGLVRSLQFLPANHPDRARFEQLFKDMAGKILSLQQPDGLWRSSLLDPENYPAKETSGSGFFTYALAWGVNQGLLDRAKFEPAVRKAWTALGGCVDDGGKLTHVQPIGGKPAKFAEDFSAPYAVGAFLLAGSEVYRMQVFLYSILSNTVNLEKIDPELAKKTPQFYIPIKVTNPSAFRRDCETVEVKCQDLAAHNFGVGIVGVIDGMSSRILDSQVYNSNPPKEKITKPPFPKPDKLLFQTDLAPNETKTFYIFDAMIYVGGAKVLPAVPPPIVKTFARYVPERYDDFAWESDRIAHRAYGQALIKAEGTITSGPDVWIKSRRNLMVNEMYASGHYHMDNGDEMDDYRVGHSRGCGGLGIWDGKKLFVSSNYHNWKLITTGPIRSEFELTYDAWDAGDGRMVSETKRYSIDAGSYFTKAQSTFASDPANAGPLTIGVGLAERACPTNRVEFFARDQDEGWLAYWQPEDKPKGIIGDAIILAKGSVLEFTNDAPNLPDSELHANVPQPTHEGYPPIRNQLAITQAEVGQPLTYYFGACWDRSGDFTNHVAWENYVARFAERRDQPLQVTVGN